MRGHIKLLGLFRKSFIFERVYEKGFIKRVKVHFLIYVYTQT